MDIIMLIKDNDNSIDKKYILQELFWLDYSEVSENDMRMIISPYLLQVEEVDDIAGVQRLYSNPDGAYIEIFEDVIIDIYKRFPLGFIEAATTYPDQGLNVLYIFRNKGIFGDYIIEKNKVMGIEGAKDLIEEINLFFRMYDSLCHT